ncbi:hypothetical protein C1N53_12370 [Pontibacter sp. SGAir0037]|nr:hypothetical protein C1N53_12370 [Pontibacter sp. SGAir0037]
MPLDLTKSPATVALKLLQGFLVIGYEIKLIPLQLLQINAGNAFVPAGEYELQGLLPLCVRISETL